MSRTVAQIPYGQNGTTKFPVYTYRPRETGVGGDHSTSGAPTVPGSPVQYACQKNFVIMITDGEPTKDDFDSSAPTTPRRASAASRPDRNFNVDGETGADGIDEGSPTSTTSRVHAREGLPPGTSTATRRSTSTRLGFTTNAAANALLQKTATVAERSYHFTTTPSSLDLRSSPRSPTCRESQASRRDRAGTAPRKASSSTSPSVTPKESPYWEGTCAPTASTGAGDILDANDNCAIDDPRGNCFSGPFLPVSSSPPFWDAADELPAPASRNLYTSVLRGATPVPTLADFVAEVAPATTGVTATDLNIVWPLAATAPGSLAPNADEYAEELVANVRGCEFGTGVNSVACVAREGQLGDIFHSNPVVVGQPVYYNPIRHTVDGFKGLVEWSRPR